MDFFERHKALIITSLLFGITVLALVNITLSNSNKELATTLIDLEHFEIVQPEEQQEQPEPPEPASTPSPSDVRTHQAYNQNQEETEPLESRLNEIFERHSAESEASEEESSSTNTGDIALPKKTGKEKKRDSDGNASSEKTSAQSGNFDHSSISFSLVGRNALDIPNPIYTCDRPGKIVVNITVDAAGNVKGTSINKSSSSTSNECLTKKALEYATGAIFSKSTRASQIGTITYNFQG